MSSINLMHSATDPVKEASTPETLSLAGEESTFTKDYSTSCNSSKDGSGSGNTDNEPVAGCIPCSVEVQLDEAASETNNLATTVGEFKEWCGTKFFSDLVAEGLEYLNHPSEDVVMIYECPSSNTDKTSFQNVDNYFIHDYPPTPVTHSMLLLPLRYSVMNGDATSVFFAGQVPNALVAHWHASIPGFKEPHFIPAIPTNAKVHAYLPMEGFENNVHDPDVHYRLAGKDVINEMTDKTTKLLPNTKTVRPCIAKVTHAKGSLGIFVIRNDDDEAEFAEFLDISGNPDYVVTELVNIHQNLSCHFFMHPNGDVIWFGSSENLQLADGTWSDDSTIELKKQELYREMMAPYVRDVVQYCLLNGHWGFAGIDVLFDFDGAGYTVDVNPRVTGTMPALMAAQLLNRSDLEIGKFRKSSKYTYFGGCDELMAKVEAYNAKHSEESMIIVLSAFESEPSKTFCNMAVFGKSHDGCESVIESFLQTR